eukprot:3913105-Rhodomonas_salina.3
MGVHTWVAPGASGARFACRRPLLPCAHPVSALHTVYVWCAHLNLVCAPCSSTAQCVRTPSYSTAQPVSVPHTAAGAHAVSVLHTA